MTMIGGVTEYCARGAEPWCPGFDISDDPEAAASRASSTFGGQTRELAFDGDADSFWSAGAHPIQWIEIDLGEPKKIASLRLLASQDPAGRTVHVISIDGLEVVTLDGETAGRDLLVVALASPVTGQVVRVTTTISPSWVAWYEIEIDLVP